MRDQVALLEDRLQRLGRAQTLLRTARERLDDVAKLSDDWDSYGAARPTGAAISAAHNLLASLWEDLAERADEAAIPWMIAPLADGGVQLEWRGPGGAIEVEINPEGKLNFLVEQNERTIRRSEPEIGVPVDVLVAQIRDVQVAPPHWMCGKPVR